METAMKRQKKKQAILRQAIDAIIAESSVLLKQQPQQSDFAQDLRRFVVLSAALLAALAVLVLLALVPAEALLRRWALPLGLLGWLLLAGPTLAWTVAKEHISLVDPLAPAFVAAFLLHVLLPLKQLASLLMGPVTSAGLLATTALLADWDTRHFGYQVSSRGSVLAFPFFGF
ncbi:hypothetical protein HPB51_026503 [Rhipicephalus microplus]|uniref:Uncharacterized protein n=1 Tax=Rhipicephalus microplus TaxID=6941 RepID=A0A9J6D2V2_RHIMP|nr:hypothetical protein HPB51_026503 [Rhipicephalus microplus]